VSCSPPTGHAHRPVAGDGRQLRLAQAGQAAPARMGTSIVWPAGATGQTQRSVVTQDGCTGIQVDDQCAAAEPRSAPCRVGSTAAAVAGTAGRSVLTAGEAAPYWSSHPAHRRPTGSGSVSQPACCTGSRRPGRFISSRCGSETGSTGSAQRSADLRPVRHPGCPQRLSRAAGSAGASASSVPPSRHSAYPPRVRLAAGQRVRARSCAAVSELEASRVHEATRRR